MNPTTSTNASINVARLHDMLKQQEMAWSPECATTDFYLSLSRSIQIVTQHASSEPYLLRDWVWINAQFRIAHPYDEYTARTSWAAIGLFIFMVQQLESGSRDILADICWLTDRTVETLLDQLGAQAINRFISPAEQSRIDDLIIELAESDKEDLEELELVAKMAAKEFSMVHHTAYFPSISNKLLALCNAARESSETGYWAKAALRYVHLEQDVIDDNQGYIGFLDDIHVIENMYGFVFGELPWKRLIDHTLEKWPFLTRAYWLDGNTKNHLTPLLKAAISCCLNSYLEENQSRTIVLPEVGPCGFLAAAACVMAGLDSEESNALPKPGAFASFRDGHIARYVQMLAPFQSPDGDEVYMIKLGDCTSSISPALVDLLEPISSCDVVLASSKHFKKWLTNIEADYQTAIRRFHRVDTQTSVVYVTNRSAFFSFLDNIRPYGRRLDELVAVEYRSRINKTSLGSGAFVTDPAMIVCSNLDVAENILRNREANPCKPRYMIVDRAVDHISLAGSVERVKQYNPEIKIVSFSPVDTGARFYSNNRSESVWLIQPKDIDPPPKAIETIPISATGKGPLANYVNRQNRAPNAKLKTHIVEFPELDKFYEIAQKIAQRAKDEDDLSILRFAMNAETALKYISIHPPVGSSLHSGRLTSVLTNLSQHAMAMGMYDQDIDSLAVASSELIQAINTRNPKAHTLFDLIGSYKDCHVVVASRSIAESLSKTDLGSSHVKIQFIPVHDLELLDNIELLIVPGWLGRKEMLRLQLGGWSGEQIRLLYNFEYRRVSNQNRKLERTLSYLGERTRESWKSFSINNPEAGDPPAITKEIQSPEAVAGSGGYDEELEDEDSWIESAIRSHINSASKNKSIRTEIIGRLVFFNDGQHFGVFAENAKLVCLNEILGGALKISQLNETDAEKLLWKSTKHLESGDVLAFPDDPALGDIIDGLADELIGDDGATRKKSGLWRNALREIYEACGWDLEKMQKRLFNCGVARTLITLESWLFSTKTIAPKNPSETIPNILECAGNTNSPDLVNEILKDVNTIYAARRKAGHILVSQLSTASLSALGDNAFVEINGKKIRYKILSITSIDEAAKFDASLIGIHTIGDGLLETKQ